MSDPSVVPELAPLPHAHILGYVTGNATATRVRRVTLIALRSLSALHLLLAIVIALGCAYDFHRYAVSYYSYTYYTPYGYALYPATAYPATAAAPSPYSLTRLLRYLADNPFPALCAALTFACALILFLCPGPATRGKRSSGYLAVAALCPLGFSLLLLSAVLITAAIYMPFFDREGGPGFFLLVLPGLLVILPILLLTDLAAYTLWAARNPFSEKPSTPFLPARTQRHNPQAQPPESLSPPA